jgi:hypothetical protein
LWRKDLAFAAASEFFPISMLRKLPVNLLGAPDSRVLLVGFAGAFRSFDLVLLQLEDRQFTADGGSKTLELHGTLARFRHPP